MEANFAADVVIIGAGVVGCAAARYLSRYKLDVVVLEKGADVAVGATKANSGILHSGYDCHPGTLKAALNIEGLAMYPQLARDLDIPYRINGSLVVCFDDNEAKSLEELMERGRQNGVTDLELLTGKEVLGIEPNLSPSITGALRAKNAGIVSPYEAAVAFAENAARNGVTFRLNTRVTNISVTKSAGGKSSYADTMYTVETTNGNFRGATVINAAGINSAAIHNMVCPDVETISPQRGEYYLLDNNQRELVSHTIFQMPTILGKGVLVTPTIEGNILLGPTAEKINDADDTSTTINGLHSILGKVGLSLQKNPIRDRITAFAGVRAKHESKDFILREAESGFFDAIGIDSPGLTAAPAIAKLLAEMVLARIQPTVNRDFDPCRAGIKRFRDLSRKAQQDYIRTNPSYGRIVCRCETITEPEILESIQRPVGAGNLDAIKRRTRAQMGRCQGGFCTIRLMELLSTELGVPETEITKDGPGSELVYNSYA